MSTTALVRGTQNVYLHFIAKFCNIKSVKKLTCAKSLVGNLEWGEGVIDFFFKEKEIG